MGLMDKLGKGLKTVAGVSLPSMKEPSSLGKVGVGQKAELELPAGQVAVWYQIPRTEIFHEDREGEPIIVEPGDLAVSLRPAGGGDPLTMKRGSGSSSFQDLKHQRCKVGDVDVPAAGNYSVESSSSEAPGSAELLFDG
jgi:hypothetical protein